MKDKEKTKRKLIAAVGELIRLEGFDALTASKVARKAEIDRKLIARYFGGLNQLIEAYVVENDYWMVFSDILKEILNENDAVDIKKMIVAILQNQFRYFYSGKEMQRLILWEISQVNPLMKSIHKAREAHGQKILEETSAHFKGSNVNIRAITALLVGGIYYAVLHARFNGGMISDINIDTQEGQESILNALEQIVGWAFADAEKGKT